jgi:hypothetical protein
MENRKIKQVLSGVGTRGNGDIKKRCGGEYGGNMYLCMKREK